MAGIETKSDFSRMLGLKDPDHYIGAENDTPGKRPSLDVLEGAARLAGFEFPDCIQLPDPKKKKPNKDHEQLHRQLQEILDGDSERAKYLAGNIKIFHEHHLGRRRRKR